MRFIAFIALVFLAALLFSWWAAGVFAALVFWTALIFQTGVTVGEGQAIQTFLDEAAEAGAAVDGKRGINAPV